MFICGFCDQWKLIKNQKKASCNIGGKLIAWTDRHMAGASKSFQESEISIRTGRTDMKYWKIQKKSIHGCRINNKTCCKEESRSIKVLLESMNRLSKWASLKRIFFLFLFYLHLGVEWGCPPFVEKKKRCYFWKVKWKWRSYSSVSCGMVLFWCYTWSLGKTRCLLPEKWSSRILWASLNRVAHDMKKGRRSIFSDKPLREHEQSIIRLLGMIREWLGKEIGMR